MKRFQKSIISLALILLCGTPVYAFDLNFGPMAQSEFDNMVRDVGTLITYRAMAPAEPGGLLGFDVSVAASAVKIDTALWNQIIPSEIITEDYVFVPSLRARLGLPLNFDVGASFAQVPGSDIQMLGGEVQWAMWDGSAATPALAFRGHYSSLLNVNELDLTTYGADAVISKGFAIFTPYAGIGAVYMDGKYNGSLPANLALSGYSDTSVRYFGGLRMTLTLLQITADIEYLEQPVYSLKVGLGW